MLNLPSLYHAVQRNCHLSDSWYAQDYGLCTYLLKMRELYRWEKKLPLTAPLSKAEVGEWLEQREQLWEQLSNESLVCLPIAHDCYDPFDIVPINQHLLPHGLVYSAGYERLGKPSFFIGRLICREWREGAEIFVTDEEYVRDLTAPPAMTLASSIFIRRESLQRYLWEKLANWQPSNQAVAQILDLYGFQETPQRALDKLTDTEMETLIYHEMGELQVSRLLGERWETLLASLLGSPAERVARAVRDHLADCLVTLPMLLERQQVSSLLFYWVNLQGLRKEIFPSLVAAYQKWLLEPKKVVALSEIVKQGQEHWLTVAQSWLEHQTMPEVRL